MAMKTLATGSCCRAL